MSNGIKANVQKPEYTNISSKSSTKHFWPQAPWPCNLSHTTHGFIQLNAPLAIWPSCVITPHTDSFNLMRPYLVIMCHHTTHHTPHAHRFNQLNAPLSSGHQNDGRHSLRSPPSNYTYTPLTHHLSHLERPSPSYQIGLITCQR